LTRVPLIQWRVRATTLQYAFYRLDSANPFQSAIYQLVQRDRRTGATMVQGLFTDAQYRYRVARIVERSDCEVF
jgi:hypothetical protein